MSKKCRAYSESRLGLEPSDNRKAFYAGWDAALAEQPAQTPVAVYRAGRQGEPYHVQFLAHMEGDEVFLYASPQPAQEQEPVAWQILNGVCHAGIRSTEDLAKEAAAGMQKTHDLGGSLAAFHVRPLYASPQPAQEQEPLTDAQIGAVAADIWGSILLAPQSYQAFARAIEAKLKEKNT